MGQITPISPTFAPMYPQHCPAFFPRMSTSSLGFLVLGLLFLPIAGRAQWLGLSYAVDTAFYAPLPLPGAVPGSPGEAFDSDGLLEGSTSYWIYAHFSSPMDRLQAVYALNSGNSLTPSWKVQAECGCFEHPFGSSVWNTLNWPISPLFPELAYDSYFTLDHHPGTSIAGTLPLINGPSNLTAICNLNLEDVAMYVLGGVQAGSDLRIPIARITTCGPVDFQACFQVSPAAGGPVQNVCTTDPGWTPLHIDPPCADYALMTTEVWVDALSPGTPVIFEDAGAGSDPLEITLFDVEAGSWMTGTWSGPTAIGIPPGTYFAAIKDSETCRDTTEVFCVPPPFEFCGGGCINDGDGDGICDEAEIPGCGDEQACNYEPAYTDLVPCIYPEPGYDCDGECLADGDGDGVCDPFEVGGCMEPYACNFDPAATDDDGSCTFLATGLIAGPAASMVGATETYTYPAAPGHGVTWSVLSGGTLLSAPADAGAQVLWTTPGLGTVSVVEANDTCASAPVLWEVMVESSSDVGTGAAAEAWGCRWAPGGGGLWLEVPAGAGRVRWLVTDVTGRLLAQGTLDSSDEDGGENGAFFEPNLALPNGTAQMLVLRCMPEQGPAWGTRLICLEP